MKERPILFSGPMVRAILDGRKTVTRRVVKLNQSGRVALCGKNWHRDDPDSILACPYGQPGDRLWVRETHCFRSTQIDIEVMGHEDLPTDGRPWKSYGTYSYVPIYRATEEAELIYDDEEDRPNCQDCQDGNPHGHWKPSIHMPRWASRISLEVTEIRVQRLQDITEDEAIREGAVWHDFGRECGHFGAWQGVGDCKGEFHPQRNGWTMEPPAASAGNCLPSARMAFANLINKINGPETWASNPWVFVISFRRMYAQ